MWTNKKWRQVSIYRFSNRHYAFDGTCIISPRQWTKYEEPYPSPSMSKLRPLGCNRLRCAWRHEQNSSQSTIATCGSAIRHQPWISTLPNFSVHTLFFETFIHPLRILSPTQVLHRVRHNASTFNFRYLLSFLKLSSRYPVRLLLLRLPVNSTFSYICPPIICFRRQFLHNTRMWPTQSAVLRFLLCRKSLSSLTLWNTSSFLVSNFRRVPNVVCFLLGNSPASEFYMLTFRNVLSVPSS